MNFLETIFLFFAFQAFVFSILFFLKKKGDRIANILLGTYILLFSYNIIYNVLYWTNLLNSLQYIHLTYTNRILWVLYGPILFLYIRRVIYKNKFRSIDILHFIPLFYALINYSPFYFLTVNEKIETLINGKMGDYIYFYTPYSITIIVALMLFYCGLLFFSFRPVIKSFNNSRWLNWLSYSFCGYVLSFSSYFVLVYFNLLNPGSDYFIGFSMIFFTGLLSYFGFLQPQVFDGLSMDKVLPFKKYQKTGLSKKYSLELKTILIDFMKEDKPYLDNQIRISHLAKKLNISKHHMSQVINEHFDLSFFDFINTYRVDQAKHMLTKDNNLNMTEILYSCGFNNRVSFYKAFKKFTKMTPSEYKLLKSKESLKMASKNNL
ncbi:AraC family transcriptional regulator [Aquimarina algiphila]|uniref:AraC family transcriptional regulator n=3 Tax=Flavobacteriaceae TaxID=49546 RepID=A0A554VHS0_9FLAO|nr:AraC family transcriptional regulator [Aquimarina algiphila]